LAGFEVTPVGRFSTDPRGILAISVWNDSEAKALAEQFGAKALIDKARLFSDLIPAIKLFCLKS
jgi:hypothetical protein